MLPKALRFYASRRLAPLLAICIIGNAGADETANSPSSSLSTPPLTIGTLLACLVANVGKSPVTVDIALHDINGDVSAGGGCTLPPGAVDAGGRQCSVVEAAPAGFVGYCTFSVGHGSKNDLRGAILSFNANQGLGAVPATLPAQ